MTIVNAALTVTRIALTITANSLSKVYGAAMPALTASYAGFVNGDTSSSLTTQPTLSTPATASSHVAGSPYAITDSGAVDADYAISYSYGTLSVAPAPLTITANNQTMAYRAALPALTASYSGLVNGDSSTSLTTQPTLTTTATASSSVLGGPYQISVSGAVDTDYSIAYAAGTLTVTPLVPVVSVSLSAATIVYGQSLTLAATLSAPFTPNEGTVTFNSGGVTLASVPVVAGAAGSGPLSLPIGNYQIVATYADPIGNFAPAGSSVGGATMISKIAGAGLYAGDGGPATSANLQQPDELVVDAAGNIFIADTANNVVRKVNHATGVISTVAGNGAAGYNGDNIAATAAELDHPLGLALDASGDLLIVDCFNDRIREVNASSGIITTVAGTRSFGYNGDNIQATAAELDSPAAIALDSAGDLFIADTNNQRIREVNQSTGVIATFAGNGIGQYSGDGGAATSAGLEYPKGIVVDSAGNVFIADSNDGAIREVPAGATFIKTIAGTQFFGGSIGNGGPASAAALSDPLGLAVDSSGDLFIADSGDGQIREINASTKAISLIAGGGSSSLGDGGVATAAALYYPSDIAVDASGNIFVADPNNERVREVNASSKLISTVAGTSYVSVSGDGGAATAAQLDNPNAVATDASGDIFIADSIDNVVREINHATGIVTTIAGNGTAGYSGDGGQATAAELSYPEGIAVDAAGDVFIADSDNARIREINHASRLITTVAGTGGVGYNGDNIAATSAKLGLPDGLVLDSAGDLFIADFYNQRIREVNSTGIITTVAGNGTSGYSGDGGQATAAELDFPEGLAMNAGGDLFIAGNYDNRIREVNHATGIISTVVGTGAQGFAGDGGQATAAELNGPKGIAVDRSGDLYIADTFNNRIREVNAASGIITTITGGNIAGLAGNGGPASAAQLQYPDDVYVDALGDLIIADTENNVVRELVNGTSLAVNPLLVAFTAGAAPVAIDASLTLSDNNSSASLSATVTITGGLQSGDLLSLTAQNGITGVYSAGVLTLSGGGSGASAVANYQAALQSVMFSSSSGSTAPRTLSVVVTDGSQAILSTTQQINVSSPAEITGVFVSGGSSWASQYYTYLANNGLGNATAPSLGYALKTGASQLTVLPWTNINTISVQFNENVNVDANHAHRRAHRQQRGGHAPWYHGDVRSDHVRRHLDARWHAACQYLHADHSQRQRHRQQWRRPGWGVHQPLQLGFRPGVSLGQWHGRRQQRGFQFLVRCAPGSRRAATDCLQHRPDQDSRPNARGPDGHHRQLAPFFPLCRCEWLESDHQHAGDAGAQCASRYAARRHPTVAASCAGRREPRRREPRPREPCRSFHR